MPCSSEPSRWEYEQHEGMTSQFRVLADRLTHANDVIREYLLGNVEHSVVMKFINLDVERASTVLIKKAQGLYVRVNPDIIQHVEELVADYKWLNDFATRQTKMKPSDFDRVKADQFEHRKEDIARLIKTFANDGDISKLRLVLDASASAPLAPQLGFDPDDY